MLFLNFAQGRSITFKYHQFQSLSYDARLNTYLILASIGKYEIFIAPINIFNCTVN
jgi:hypothetical protein